MEPVSRPPPLAMASYATHPIRTLVSTFAAWKLVLLIIAAGARIGTPYDASSTLRQGPHASLAIPRTDMLSRLPIWDAVVYVKQSRIGYECEQDWAFGSGLPTAISFCKRELARLV